MSIKLTESGFMPTRYSIMTEEYSISKFNTDFLFKYFENIRSDIRDSISKDFIDILNCIPNKINPINGGTGNIKYDDQPICSTVFLEFINIKNLDDNDTFNKTVSNLEAIGFNSTSKDKSYFCLHRLDYPKYTDLTFEDAGILTKLGNRLVKSILEGYHFNVRLEASDKRYSSSTNRPRITVELRLDSKSIYDSWDDELHSRPNKPARFKVGDIIWLNDNEYFDEEESKMLHYKIISRKSINGGYEYTYIPYNEKAVEFYREEFYDNDENISAKDMKSTITDYVEDYDSKTQFINKLQ